LKNRLALVACLALVAIVAAVASGGASAGVARTASTQAAAATAGECAAPNPADLLGSDAFWYWQCAAFLHVAVSPAGESKGYVRSDPYYIDCPWACTRPYEPGTQTTLYAFPSNGVSFDGWSGDACAGQGNPCTLTVSGDMTVTAKFTGDIVPPDRSTDSGTSPQMDTVSIFMGYDPGPTISGTNGYVCNGFGCDPAMYPDGTVVTITSSEPCTYFNDSLAPGNFNSPYTFTVNSPSRQLTPHGFAC
jgi:hypothetical protein